jgi:hypothetical protein
VALQAAVRDVQDQVPGRERPAGRVGGDGRRRICRQVPGVPATVQTNSAPFWSRQKSPTFHAPEVGGPFSVFGLPFW